ncbi:MAG: rRNA maturation RNase YbeY [Ferruginibacter sp.]
MVIKFFFNNASIKIPARKKLKQYITALFEKEGTVIFSLSYIFCSDKDLLSINKEFLGHHDYTDIITFTLSNPTEPIEGEIYISVDRIKDNAKKIGVNINEELHRIIFHGALHLCGYKDKITGEKKEMTNAEDSYLNGYFR